MFKFDDKYQVIGKGKQALVLSDGTFAYKVFNDNYPKEWIQYEYDLQKKINRTNLPVIKYWDILDTNCIKMDLVQGKTLGDLLFDKKLKHSVEILIKLQKEIHSNHGLNLPSFKKITKEELAKVKIDKDYINLAYQLLNLIEDGSTLLHLDLHFLNIMMNHDQITVIDWVNAKEGNPIFDYARSYIIMNEYVFRLGQKYLRMIKKDCSINTEWLDEAIFIMALLRLNEEQNPRTLNLIESLYQSLKEKHINQND